MRLAIADPPYPPHVTERFDLADGSARIVSRSRASRYYGDGPHDQKRRRADFHPAAGAWDDPDRHRALLEQLHEHYDGWAIATSLDGLDCYRPLPPGARVLIWRKLTSTRGGGRVANTMEAVIVMTHHSRRGRIDGLGQVSDFLQCEPPKARFPGAKPPRWTRWVLDALAYDAATDTVDDLFPGSGLVTSEINQGVLL
ncbi:hypothetical protein [Nocardioides sp. R-C-SC26]|uniref:hypothetical protein n=1 Tax=Nocardioides sp. R-C-SC26 TaxID=2870414 RepID=UPI001E44A597|nr:hypothetical protein [Nocardioides sp. R-C-SC26]